MVPDEYCTVSQICKAMDSVLRTQKLFETVFISFEILEQFV